MLNRQKELLNAQFARGNLEIHKKVVSLYLLNLVTVVMFALIALAQFVNGLRVVPDFILDHPRASWAYLIASIMGIYSSLMTSLLAITMYTYGYANFLQTENHKKTIGMKWIPSWRAGASMIFISCQALIFIVGISLTYIYGSRAVNIFSEHSRDPVAVSALIRKYSHSRVISSLPMLNTKPEEYAERGKSASDVSLPVCGSVTPNGESGKSDRGEGSQSSSQLSRESSNVISRVARSATVASGHAYSMLSSVLEEDDGRDVESAMEISELKRELRQKMRNVRARGVLWNKSLRLENGVFQPLNYFVKTYAVMERGTLHFYHSKEHFADIRDSIDSCPIYLKNFELSTDSRTISKHDRNFESVSSYLRNTIFGTSEVLLGDVLAADFDMEYATKMFKFALIPKDFSELGHLEPIILMAEDEEAYRLWTIVFSEIIEGYRLLHSFKQDTKELDLIRDAKTAVALVHHQQQRNVRVRVPTTTDLSSIF